jgi:Ca2+/Na+ antiporter
MKFFLILPSFLLLVQGFQGLPSFPNINNIKNIITSKAVFTTFTNSMNSELMNENFIITEMNRLEYHHQLNVVYLVFFAVSFYLSYSYNQNIENKWENLEMFSKTKKNTRIVLLMFMIVFTKNMDNAI